MIFMIRTAKVIVSMLLIASMFAGCAAAPGDTTGGTEPAKPTTDDIVAHKFANAFYTFPDDRRT